MSTTRRREAVVALGSVALAVLLLVAGCRLDRGATGRGSAEPTEPVPTPTMATSSIEPTPEPSDNCDLEEAAASEYLPIWWPERIEPDVVWVAYRGDPSDAKRDAFVACAGLREIDSIRRLGTFKYRVADDSSVPSKVALVQVQRIVSFALPNPTGPWPQSGDSPGNFAAGELSVKFNEFPDAEWSDSFAESHGLRVFSRTPETGWFGFEIVDGSSVLDKAAELSAIPEVYLAIPVLYGVYF